MNNNPFLSIILPTYNSEVSLSKCIDSIVNQTYTNYEILVIDNVSKDNTLAVIKKYNDSRIRIFSEKDKGIYDAMNKGIDLANGDWLYFMGSDDSLFKRTTLEKIAELKSIKEYNVIYGNVRIKGDTGWAKEGDIYDGEFNTKKIFNKNISHQAIFYNSNFVKQIGYFNLEYKTCSDWDFNLRCWSRTNFYYVEMIISNFYSGGLSSNGNDEVFSIDFVSNILKYFKINLFNSLINSPTFKDYLKVKSLQKSEHPFRYRVNHLFDVLMKVVLKKVNR